MCGQFALVKAWEKIAREFGLSGTDKNLSATGNIHPGDYCTCIVGSPTGNEAVTLQWGFRPEWMMKNSGKKLLINARAETIAVKPAFSDAFQKRRCLIVAEGFYEWTKEKKPFYFYLKSGAPFGLAGVYESSPTAGFIRKSFVIITTRPNEVIAPLHDRMPVIIPADKRLLWLNNTNYDRNALRSLLVPYPALQMAMRPAAITADPHLDVS
jgi:putative SOS response-associated peptidase YedK